MSKTIITIEIDCKCQDKEHVAFITSFTRKIMVNGKTEYADEISPEIYLNDPTPINLLQDWLMGKSNYADHFVQKNQFYFKKAFDKMIQEAINDINPADFAFPAKRT